MTRICTLRHKKKLGQLNIPIHQSALPAFEFFNSCSYIFDRSSFKFEQLNHLNHGLTIHMVELKNNDLAIISGFESITFSLANIHYPDCDIIIHDELTHDEIEKKAWLCVLRSLLSSVNPKQLECFRRDLNKSVPQRLIRDVFQKKQVSQATWVKHSVLSRSALAQQFSSLNEKNELKPESDDSEMSIYEQLSRGEFYE